MITAVKIVTIILNKKYYILRSDNIYEQLNDLSERVLNSSRRQVMVGALGGCKRRNKPS